MKANIMKVLKENTEEYLYNLRTGKNFTDRTQKATTRKKMKLEFIKTNNYSSKILVIKNG